MKSTIDLPRILSISGLLKSWTDASYAVHNDYRGHIGGVISAGEGIICTKSSKQKLNARSSTESEIICASDFISWTLWMTQFMEKQGCPIKTNIFYQDNENAIKIEKNGQKSYSSKSRHLNVRFFLIKDHLEQIICKSHIVSQKT